MAFSVHIHEHEESNTIHLKDAATGCVAEIFSFGAVLNKFSIPVKGGELNVIDGFESVTDAKENITNGFKSTKLSPFVCRLNKGRYSFEGNNYIVDKFYLGESAIHGLLFDLEFRIIDSGTNAENAFVTLLYHYNKTREGFPFSYTCTVQYVLTQKQTLHLITTIENTGSSDMPVSDGWHPYFRFDTPINNLEFQMNCDKFVVFDEGLIPTGEMKVSEIFLQPSTIGETFLDNCFKVKDGAKATCTLSDPSSGRQVNITADKSYPYLQIYTPPHRNSIAIENLSSVPDAFNNKIDLLVLKPGVKKTFETSYQLL